MLLEILSSLAFLQSGRTLLGKWSLSWARAWSRGGVVVASLVEHQVQDQSRSEERLFGVRGNVFKSLLGYEVLQQPRLFEPSKESGRATPLVVGEPFVSVEASLGCSGVCVGAMDWFQQGGCVSRQRKWNNRSHDTINTASQHPGREFQDFK